MAAVDTYAGEHHRELVEATLAPPMFVHRTVIEAPLGEIVSGAGVAVSAHSVWCRLNWS